MKKGLLNLLALCLVAAFSQTASALKPEIRKYAFDDSGILQVISDNGQWALATFGTSELAEMGKTKIVNVQTGAYESIQTDKDIALHGKQTFSDITNDGQIVVGAFKGNAAYWHKITREWVELPTPDGCTGAVATHVTPDGQFAIGVGMDHSSEYFKKGVMWNLKTGTIVDLPNIPTLDMTHEDQGQCQFISMSSDGRYILGSLSYSFIQPVAPCVFLYDRETSTAKFIGFDPHDTQAWKPWVDGLMFLDEGRISANGKYVVCHAWMYKEAAGSATVDGDAVAYYEVETGKFEVLPGSNGMYANVVDNNGTVYAATPANSPIREWALYRNGYWYSAAQILKQAYDMNFYAYTDYENTGTVTDISGDGRVMTVMADPQGGSYTLTAYDDLARLCESINLLQNYTVTPATGSVFSKLRSVEIAFDRNVQVVGQVNAAALTKSNGTLVRNSAGLAVSAQSRKAIVVTFRPQTLEEGETYTLTVPAGVISLENDPAKVNGEIRIEYHGRADKAVAVTNIYPKDGAVLARIDNASNPVVITFDTRIATVANATAELRMMKEDGSGYEKVCNLNLNVSDNLLYVYPAATQYLYQDKKYQVVVSQGAVTDLSGSGASEEIVLHYTGSYIREVSYDSATLFKDDFSNQAQSLLNFMRFEGDHLTPTEAMQALGFDADNQPWNFSIHESETSTDYCAAATSMYADNGKSDDWMVIPQLEIPDEYVTLTFKSQSYAKNKQDRLKVLVWECEENFNALSADVMARFKQEAKVVFDEALTPGASEEELSGDWTDYAVSLAAYSGKKIYIAFLNDNVRQSMVFVDDVAVQREMKFFVSLANAATVVAQEHIKISGTLTANAENEVFTSAKLTLKDHNGTVIDEISATGLSLAKGDKFPFTFDTPLPLEKGIANKCVIAVELDAYTDDVNCTIKNLAFEPVKRVVLEEVTGVTCGNCPQGILAIEELKALYGDLVIPVSIHTYTGDPFAAGLEGYSAYLGLNAAPSAMVQRSGIISYPMGEDLLTGDYTFSNGYTLWKDLVAAEFEVPADADIHAEYRINEDGTFDLPVTIKYALDAHNLNLNIFMVMMEDSIKSYQDNYFSSNSDPIFGEWGLNGRYGQPTVYDVIHNDLARACWGTSYSGTAGLMPQSMTAGEVYTAQLTGFSLPENISVVENTKIVVMMIDGNTNKLVNAVCVKPTTDTAIGNLSGTACKVAVKDGHVQVFAPGECTAKVYAVDGTLLGQASGRDNLTIATAGYKGVALVRIIVDGKEVVKKVVLDN